MSLFRTTRSLPVGFLLLTTALFSQELVNSTEYPHADAISTQAQQLAAAAVCSAPQISDAATQLETSVTQPMLTVSDVPAGLTLMDLDAVLAMKPEEFFSLFSDPTCKEGRLHGKHLLRYIRAHACACSALHELLDDARYDELSTTSLIDILNTHCADLDQACRDAFAATPIEHIATAFFARRETIRFLNAFASDNQDDWKPNTWKRFVEATVPFIQLDPNNKDAVEFLLSYRDASGSGLKARANAAGILMKITKFEKNLDPQTCSFMSDLYKKRGSFEMSRRLSYMLAY